VLILVLDGREDANVVCTAGGIGVPRNADLWKCSMATAYIFKRVVKQMFHSKNTHTTQGHRWCISIKLFINVINITGYTVKKDFRF